MTKTKRRTKTTNSGNKKKIAKAMTGKKTLHIKMVEEVIEM